MVSRLDAIPDFQSDFPHVDISDEMADVLGSVLEIPGTINGQHISAEHNSYLYRIGHFQFYQAVVDSQTLDADRLDALSDGMGLYEITSSLMRQAPDRVDEHVARLNIIELRNTLVADSGLWTISEARDEFIAKLPRTARAISQCAIRFHGSNSTYAVGGAAISWLAERNANEDIRGLDF